MDSGTKSGYLNRLNKKARVNDPWQWYNRPRIEVSLYIFDWGENYQRLSFIHHRYDVDFLANSIDDFAMRRCEYADTLEEATHIFEELKFSMWDRMPNRIGVEWLREHGCLCE